METTPPPTPTSGMGFGHPAPSTPRRGNGNFELGHTPLLPPSLTPDHGNGTGNVNSGGIMSPQHTIIPPSPGTVPAPTFASFTASPLQGSCLTLCKSNGKKRTLTGAGVKKTKSKKIGGTVAKLANAALGDKTGESDRALEKPFRFMDLPGEIRNLVYTHTYESPKQALLVHRPRIASLRERTRLDRSRPLASDVTGQDHDNELSSATADKKTHRASS